MITDNQVKKLRAYLQQGKPLDLAAAKSGMDEKTGRKYRDLGRLPSEIKAEQNRDWRTRADPFVDVWQEIEWHLELNPGLEAKTLFHYLQRNHPGRFSDGQLRTFQRKVKIWRATEGPVKEIYFPQVHKPGILSQSDFTCMNDLGITIAGHSFNHLIYHFVLTYSNWETGTICFSESYESLSEGLQNALWALGGVPQYHQTDRLSAAVNKPDNPEKFTAMYQGLLRHYSLGGRRINPSRAHENGDIEQRHHRFKRALKQALMLRGSSDFESRETYRRYLHKLFDQLNSGRTERFQEEQSLLRRLPPRRLDSCTRLSVKVGPSSTIRVKHKIYSVHSRLVGETVTIRLYAEKLELWYGQRHLEDIDRLRGADKHRIQYRHIIDWLIRKPGAFANYRYRSDLFPTSRFRMAYDALCERQSPKAAGKEYLKILQLAARENETAIDDALRLLIDRDQRITVCTVEQQLQSRQQIAPATQVTIPTVALRSYDQLLRSIQEAMV